MGLGIRYNRCSLSKTGRNPSIEEGERALLVKSIQCKQENLSLSLRTHLKVEQSGKYLKSPFAGGRDKKITRVFWLARLTQ